MRRFVVTIDGPAGAGKSTIARGLAQRLGFSLLDTGAIYRCVALLVCERNAAKDDDAVIEDICSEVGRLLRFSWGEEKQRVHLGEREVTGQIRTPDVAQWASILSARPTVRRALLDIQRRFAREQPVVAEGRDMGTVVFPDAEAKFFLDADPRIRAQRRADELGAAGRAVTLEEAQRDLDSRDERDRTRQIAPLRAAQDALHVDTTGLSIDQVLARIEIEVRRRMSGEIAKPPPAV